MKIKKTHSKVFQRLPMEHLKQCQAAYRTHIQLLCLKIAFVPFFLSIFFLVSILGSDKNF